VKIGRNILSSKTLLVMKTLFNSGLIALLFTLTLNDFDRSLPAIQLLGSFLLTFCQYFVPILVLSLLLNYLNERVSKSEGKSKELNRLIHSAVISIFMVAANAYLQKEEINTSAPIFDWLGPLLLKFAIFTLVFFIFYPGAGRFKRKTA
jgi:purine-cytosine permease-like protein